MRAFLIAIGVLCAPMAMAASQETVPARIGDHEKSLRHTIDFPDVEPGESVLVFCGALVDGSGRIKRHFCFTDKEGGEAVKYRIAVERELSHSTFTPARVNGRPDEVWTQFTVAFAQKDGQPVIRVYPHIGENPDLAWDDYRSPQVLTESVRWNVHRNRIRKCKGRYLFFTDLTIDKQGELESMKFTTFDKLAPAGCRKYAEQIANMRQYIPGRVNGEPATLSLNEVWSGERFDEAVDVGDTRLDVTAGGKWKPERYPEL